MTIGEKIQAHRKRLDLSQEELGQKLLVSRQTISLWEKDQTLPTIDNLIRLREIFGTSLDEMLGLEDTEKDNAVLPSEVYSFQYSKDELDEIRRLQTKDIYKKPVIFILLCVAIIVFYIGQPAYNVAISFTLGMLLIFGVSIIKSVKANSSAWKISSERICTSTYKYELFEDYITAEVYRDGLKLHESKCFFADIEKIHKLDKWLLLQFRGQLFILRKRDLKENSAFFSYMYKNPSKIAEIPVSSKWKTAATILFVASLLSMLFAPALVGMVSNINGMYTENMWVYFLLTPIPIASTVLGFILKSKGFKYKKNIIVGLIVTFFLCVYGSFVIIF